jgi:hypothetical protein
VLAENAFPFDQQARRRFARYNCRANLQTCRLLVSSLLHHLLAGITLYLHERVEPELCWPKMYIRWMGTGIKGRESLSFARLPSRLDTTSARSVSESSGFSRETDSFKLLSVRSDYCTSHKDPSPGETHILEVCTRCWFDFSWKRMVGSQC